VLDILPAIVKINTDKFYHNDIKLSNIVYDNTSKKMKLIDWGAGKTIPDDYDNEGLSECIYRGDPIFSSLYKMYIRYTTEGDGVSKTAAERNIYFIGPNICRVCNLPSVVLKNDALVKRKSDLSYYGLLYSDSKAPPSQYFATHSIEKLFDYQSDTFQKQIRSISQNANAVSENTKIKRKLFEYRQSFDLHMFGMSIFHAVYIFDLNRSWIDEYAIPFIHLDPEFSDSYLTDTMGKIEKCIEKLKSSIGTEQSSIGPKQKVSHLGYCNGFDTKNIESLYTKTPRLDKINPLNMNISNTKQ
jgi:serine/threonine protein kinase